MAEKCKKIIVIDGNSLLYRSYYGVRAFSTSDGQPTNALYGLSQMLMRVLEMVPDYIAVAFDTPKPTFRHIEYADYKGHRKAPPDELIQQMALARDLVRAFNIPVLECEGFEADDIIGAITHFATQQKIESVIVTGDLDALQLVNDYTTVLTTVKGVTETVIYDTSAVIARFGITPHQMADYKGLKGDPSDNIPGVPGIGDKTAVELINKYGSIERILEAVEDMPEGKVKRTLLENPGLAIISKKLATIVLDIPLKIDFNDCKLINPDYNVLRELFVRLEFKTLLRRLPDVVETTEATTVKAKYIPGVCKKILTESEMSVFISQIEAAESIAIRCNLSSNKPSTAKLIGISVCIEPGNTAYFETEDTFNNQSTQILFDAPFKASLADIKPVLQNPNIKKICYDSKNDISALLLRGIDLAGVVFDISLAGWVIDASRGNYLIEELVLSYLQSEITTTKAKNLFSDEEYSDICSLTEALYHLYPILEERLKIDELLDLYTNLELPLTRIIAKMELAGVAVDIDELAKISLMIDEDIKELEESIYESAGEEFNIGSPKQLQTILYEKMNIKATKKTKTGYSTNAEVLEELSVEYPFVAEILKYRELTKLKSTYSDALPRLLNKKTGRIHTSLNQTGTATGRLSSSEPNLQNIPIRTELGREIRKSFIASPGHLLISADYSQIEFRIFAHLTKDPWLVDAFENDMDVHLATACSLFNLKPEEVDSHLRRNAKTINFSVMYGMADFTLAKQLGMGVREARAYIEEYFAKFPAVKQYTAKIIEEARQSGYVTTILGRKRYIPDINNSNQNIRSSAERAAVNTPFQGSAADIIKLAMIKLDSCLKDAGNPSRMVLQVHDELLIEAPDEIVNETAKLVKDCMESAYKLEVPLRADIKIGKNWNDME